MVRAASLEQVAGVVGDAGGDAGEVVPCAAHGVDAAFEAKEAFGGGAAEGEDELGLYDGNFCHDKGQAGGHFGGAGLAVVGGLSGHGGAEFDQGGDVDLLAADAHGF